MRCRCQSQDEQLRSRVAEPGHRFAPILPLPERPPFLPRHAFAVLHKPRAFPARHDLCIQNFEEFRGLWHNTFGGNGRGRGLFLLTPLAADRRSRRASPCPPNPYFFSSSRSIPRLVSPFPKTALRPKALSFSWRFL